MKKIKQERGITLIALVITIIVLLILAGVAISMLSGENGILTRASEAKEQTEAAQNEETAALASMELETNFITKNSKYRCVNGYITGIKIEDESSIDTIESLKNELPEGFYVVPKGKEELKEEEVNKSEALTTGTAVKKGEEIVARVIILGDVDGNGKIETSDATDIFTYIAYDEKRKEYEDYQVAAMNIYNDEYIGNADAIKILRILANWNISLQDSQYVDAKRSVNLITKTEKEAMEEYIESLEKSNEAYKWEYDGSDYYITGYTKGTTTGNDIIEGLGLTEKAYVKRDKKRITTETVQDDDEIIIVNETIIYGHILGNDGVLATIYNEIS